MPIKLDDATSTPLAWLVAGVITTFGFTVTVVKFGLDIRRDLDVVKEELRVANRARWDQPNMQLWAAQMQVANPTLRIVDPKLIVNMPP